MHKEMQYFVRDGMPRVQEKVYRSKGDETPIVVSDVMEDGDIALSLQAYEELQDVLADEYEAKHPGVMVSGLSFERAVKRADKVRAAKARKETGQIAAEEAPEKPAKKRASRKKAAAKKRTVSKE